MNLLLFISKKLCSIVSGAEGKPVQLYAANFLAGVVVLIANGIGSIMDWEGKDINHYIW